MGFFFYVGLHDLEYQNTSKVVAAKWHGFTDTGSGIVKYYWCVGKSPVVSEEYSNTECSIHDWMNVGMHTTISRKTFANISLGMDLYISFSLTYNHSRVHTF